MQPKIEFAFLCEYALAPNNQLSALTMIDFFAIKTCPETTAFYLAGVLLLGGGRFYKSQIRIVTKPGPDVMDIRCIKSEDGSFDLKALPRGEPAKIALAIPLKNVVFEQAGEYTVEIVIDDVCIHIVELHVIQE